MKWWQILLGLISAGITILFILSVKHLLNIIFTFKRDMYWIAFQGMSIFILLLLFIFFFWFLVIVAMIYLEVWEG
jgi:hypothetical protein